MARKKKKEEHVNHERWLVSYADFITLLFAFFTSLYAISTVDAKKAGKMVFSTRAAFNVDFFPTDKPVLGLTPPDPRNDPQKLNLPRDRLVPDSKKRPPVIPDARIQVKDLHAAFSELSKVVEMQKVDGINVRRVKNGIIVSLKSAIFFETGRSEIKRNSLPTLDFLAENILKTHLDVRVEGHTDETPIRGKYRSNWELATARAVSVVRYFLEQYAYPPEALSVAGFSAARVPEGADPAAAKAAGRRVDLVLMTPIREDPAAAAPGPEGRGP